jgi:hypothetical protein
MPDFDERDTVNYLEKTPKTLVAGGKNSRKKIRTNKKSLEPGRRPFVSFLPVLIAKPDERDPNVLQKPIMRDSQVTEKSRTSRITFRENYSKYKSSKSYVPRKVKAHRRLLMEQKSISDLNSQDLNSQDLNSQDLEILPELESENFRVNPKIPVKTQVELSQVETAT